MDQSIIIRIAGKEFQLKAANPDTEQLMRLAAEDVNKMLKYYDEKFPNTPLEDKLSFVSLQEAVGKLTAQRKMAVVADEAAALSTDTAEYLNGLKKGK